MMDRGDPMERLAQAARHAAEWAYCPYSRFSVGAAVLADDGRIFAGCNVENASFGLTICAERNAVFAMVAGGARRIVAVAIYTPTRVPTMPCGACRQVVREFGVNVDIIATCDGEEVERTTLAAILPEAFGPESLG